MTVIMLSFPPASPSLVKIGSGREQYHTIFYSLARADFGEEFVKKIHGLAQGRPVWGLEYMGFKFTGVLPTKPPNGRIFTVYASPTCPWLFLSVTKIMTNECSWPQANY